MGYFEGLSAGLFQRDQEGNRIYLPYGRLGKAYRVPDQKAHEIEVATRISVAIVIAGAAVLRRIGWLWGLLIIAFGIAIFFVRLAQLTKGLEAVQPSAIQEEPRSERLRRIAVSTGAPTLWALLIVSAVFTLLGMLIAVSDGSVTGWLCAGFFGICAAVFAAQLLLLRGSK